MVLLTRVAVASLSLAAAIASAQVPQYGPNITLEQARKAIAAGEAEARRNNWPVAMAVVDTAGHLVAFGRIDNTQSASIQVAQDKAASAAMYRRPTKAFQDGLAKGGDGLRILHLNRATAVDGGLPIMVEGKIVGAIGVSGVQGHEDAVVAKAGVDSLK